MISPTESAIGYSEGCYYVPTPVLLHRPELLHEVYMVHLPPGLGDLALLGAGYRLAALRGSRDSFG
jgi:hypothetical protein